MKIKIRSHKIDEQNLMFRAVDIEQAKPVAVVSLNLKDYEIYGLIVDGEYQRKGIASKLIKEIEKYAKENKIKGLSVITHPNNVRTRNLFRKLGYKEWMKYQKNIK